MQYMSLLAEYYIDFFFSRLFAPLIKEKKSNEMFNSRLYP